jgi:hypothetical protein
MAFQIRCTCGKNLQVQDEWVGKKIRCANCSEVMTVSQPVVADKDDATEMAVSATPTKTSPASTGHEFEDDDRPRSKRRREEDEEDGDEDDWPRKRRRREEDDDDRLRTPGRLPGHPNADNTTPNASIGGGILMMVIAVVWFFGALSLGWIFYYPPILFIMGIVAVVRGAMKRE